MLRSCHPELVEGSLPYFGCEQQRCLDKLGMTGNTKEKGAPFARDAFPFERRIDTDLVSAAGELTARAAASATAAETTATGAIFTGLGFVDRQGATIKVLAVKLG